MIRPTAFHDLSPDRARLVRLFQMINFGRIEELEIRNGEPRFSPTVRARNHGGTTLRCGDRLNASSSRWHGWRTEPSSASTSGMACPFGW